MQSLQLPTNQSPMILQLLQYSSINSTALYCCSSRSSTLVSNHVDAASSYTSVPYKRVRLNCLLVMFQAMLASALGERNDLLLW